MTENPMLTSVDTDDIRGRGPYINFWSLLCFLSLNEKALSLSSIKVCGVLEELAGENSFEGRAYIAVY